MLVRNYTITSKFHPLFAPEQYVVTNIADYGRKLMIERVSDGSTLIRHPDDLKSYTMPEAPITPSITSVPDQWKLLQTSDEETDSDHHVPWTNTQYQYQEAQRAPDNQDPIVIPQDPVAPQPEPAMRRSTRETKVPDRMGVHVYNERQPLDGEDQVIQPWWPGFPRNMD